jgi:outer membrane cobalamin receptor
LRPEKVTLDLELGADVGWTVGRARIEGSASVWSRRVRDPIVWLASATAVWSPQNLEAISGRGAEGHVAVAWPDASGEGAWRIAVHAAVDGSHLAFGANRNPVPYRPGVSAGGTLERRSGRAALSATATWTGARTTSIAGTRTLPAFLLVDAALSLRLPAPAISSEVVFRVLNLLDSRYELVELVPEPGRGFEVGVRVS